MDEAVLLGEPFVVGQGQLHPSPVDRHEFGAERRHHRLPGEARLDPRPHRRYGLCLLVLTRSAHQPILAGGAQGPSFRNAVTVETNRPASSIHG